MGRKSGAGGRAIFRAALALSLWGAALGWTAPLARAAAPLRVAVDATLDPIARRVDGHARLTITNRSVVPLTDVQLWLYPSHLAVRPASLGDVSFHWVYPRLFSAAHIELGAVRADGADAPVAIEDTTAGAGTLARVRLPAPLPVGGVVTIDADFATQIPQRFGSFGCVDGHCRLLGGFYPTPLHLGPHGWQVDAPPDRADVALTVRAPTGVDVLAGDVRARGAGARPISATETNVPYATVIASRRGFYQTDASVGALSIHHLHQSRHPSWLVMDTVNRALLFLQAQGLAPPAADPDGATARRTLWLVESPLRHELVQVHGQVILLSNRLFGIFPLERLRKYHRIALVRALFTGVLDGVLRDFETPDDIDLAAAALAAHLVDAFTLQEFQHIEYARDLLRPVDFIPAVDQLMYAPLVASAATYFGDVDDSDPLRDDVRRFSHPLPGGQLVYSKLLDLLGPARLAMLSRRTLGERQPFRSAAAAVFGNDLDWFWRQWLGPRPRVNYRLSSVRAEDRGRGAHVVIDIAREGDGVREPVEVAVRDGDGATQTLTWMADGPGHRFELDLPARLASVEIDPRGRLIESPLGSLRPSDDPRYDNRDPRRWRLIYSGFGGLLNISQLTANFAAIFLLKPAHDLRHALTLQAFHSESTQIGVGASYFHFFGPQATRNELTSALLGGLSAARVDPSFGLALGEAPRPGWRLSARAGVEHDDRDYLFDPWRAVGFDVIASYSLTALEDGRLFSQATVAADALRLFELLPGHVLGLEADAAATFGDLRLRSQLISASGPTGLRGFFADELLARAQVTARVQLRNDYLTDLDWNLLHLTTVRGLAGTLFADGAAISGCDGYAPSRQGLFADAGYSFRVLHDAFGIYQQLVSIDFAVPLNRPAQARDCLGATPAVARPRFVVLVSFLPNF